MYYTFIYIGILFIRKMLDIINLIIPRNHTLLFFLIVLLLLLFINTLQD